MSTPTAQPPLRFWDVAPKPSIFSYLLSSVVGPHKSVIDSPPTRLVPTCPELLKHPQPTPAGISRWNHLKPSEVSEYGDFLRANFVTRAVAAPATPTPGPLYVIDIEDTKRDMADGSLRPIIVRDNKTNKIIGCIASVLVGRLRRNGEQSPTSFNTRIIRDFCVNANYQNTGIGSYLLFAVWEDTRSIGEDAVLFMKEGAPIGRAGPTLLSSSWMYRRMRDTEDVSRVKRVPWSSLQQHLIDFTRGRTDTIFNIPGKMPRNSVALLYQGFRGAVLASFTRAQQYHPLDGESICYEAGWLEKGELLDTERQDAALQLSAAAAAILDSYWVWCRRRCGHTEPHWTPDGQYHWYAFHWTPGFHGNVELWLVL